MGIVALATAVLGAWEAHSLLESANDEPETARVLRGLADQVLARVEHPAHVALVVIDGMRDRNLIGDDGWLSEPGRAVKQRVEALTDDLAAKPYEVLAPDELDELVAALEPLAELLVAAQEW